MKIKCVFIHFGSEMHLSLTYFFVLTVIAVPGNSKENETCSVTARQRPDPKHNGACFLSIQFDDDHINFGTAQKMCARYSGNLATYTDRATSDMFEDMAGRHTVKYFLRPGITPQKKTFWATVRPKNGLPIATVCTSRCPQPSRIADAYDKAMRQLQRDNKGVERKLAAHNQALLEINDSRKKLSLKSQQLTKALENFKKPISQLPPCPKINATAWHTAWIPYHTGCFLVLKAAARHDDAEQVCVQLGGHLAALHRGAETRFVKRLVRQHAAQAAAWAGLWWDIFKTCRVSAQHQHTTRPRCTCQAIYGGVPWRSTDCLLQRSAVCQMDWPAEPAER